MYLLYNGYSTVVQPLWTIVQPLGVIVQPLGVIVQPLGAIVQLLSDSCTIGYADCITFGCTIGVLYNCYHAVIREGVTIV